MDIPGSASTNDLYVLSMVAQVAESTYSGNPTDVSEVLLADDNGHLSTVGSYGALSVTAGDIPAANVELDRACDSDQSAAQPCDVQDSFLDPAGLSAEDIDASGLNTDNEANGQASDSVAVLVIPSPVNIIKRQQVLGNNGPHPGANIEYELEINIGCSTEDILDILIADNIPPFTEFLPGSLLFNGLPPINTNFNTLNGVGYDATNNRILANFGTIPAETICLPNQVNVQHSIFFTVVINS